MWKQLWLLQFQVLADMRNIFFFDFDDTLFSHRKKQVSSRVQTALGRLHSDQNILVVASGRGRESEQFIRNELGFKPDYLILMNGQLVLQGGRLVYENYADASLMRRVMDYAEANRYACGGYYSDGILVNEMNQRVKTVWNDFQSAPPAVIAHFQEKYPLYQGHLYISKEEAQPFAEYLNDYVINWSHQFLVNLIPKAAGKSQAIRWCLQALNIKRENSYAFGDGFNDRDMLQAVGHGVAMGNGAEDLKKDAEFVTSSVDKDGVLDALEHYGFNLISKEES